MIPTQQLNEAKLRQLVGDFKPSASIAAFVKKLEELGKRKIADMTPEQVSGYMFALADRDYNLVKDSIDLATEITAALKKNGHEIKIFIPNREKFQKRRDKISDAAVKRLASKQSVTESSMLFPKLQALMEAKNKSTADEMDFDLDTGEVEEKTEKKDVPAVDKAAVLAFLKSCDAACRADVKSKLDKMVEKDLEEKETVKEAKEVSEWEFLMGVDEGSVRRTRGDAKTVMAKMIKVFKRDCALSGKESAAKCKELMPKFEAAADPKKLFSMMVKSGLAWDGYDLALNWNGGDQEWRPSATRF